ncbi:hypothetical protein GC173_07550 [bacterium]|nr:hypothetical protein [bacterium]
MITPSVDSFLLCLVAAAIIEAVALPRCRRRATGELVRPFPTLAVTMIGAWGLFALAPASFYDMQAGPGAGPLVGAAVGGIILLVAGKRSERTRPSSRRHFVATMLASLCLTVGGLRIPYLELPLLGVVELPWVLSFLLTAGWVFLITSLFEILGLVPLVAGAAGLCAGALVLMPVELFKTVPGLVLCASLLGVIIGRLIGQIAVARTRSCSTPEVLVLGYAAAASTLTIFAKNMVLSTFILPIAVVATLLVLAVIHSLNGSLMLRRTPR